MLTRNSQIEKLLKEGDFNVRVTIYNPTSVSTNPKFQKDAWLKAIRDSLGCGITTSNEPYVIHVCNTENFLASGKVVKGNNISKTIGDLCKTPVPIRITLKPLKPFAKYRVWIIA